MSTRCLIGYKNEETNMVKYCYCHFDGYPSGVGRTLLDHYSGNNELAEKLCSLKGFSSLEPTIRETMRQEYPEEERAFGEMSYEEWKRTNDWGTDYIYTYYPISSNWTVRPTFSYDLEWMADAAEDMKDPLERY